MSWRNLTMILALSAVVVVSSTAWAGTSGIPGFGAGNGCSMTSADASRPAALGGNGRLTPEEQREIKNLWLSHKQEVIELQTRMSVKQAELNSLMFGDCRDRTRLDAAMQEVAGLRNEIQQIKNSFRAEIKARYGLDPEQASGVCGN